MLPDHFKAILDEIAAGLNFTDYKPETEHGSNHGDNFQGVLVSVKLIGSRAINGKAEPSELALLVKTPPANEKRQEIFQSQLMFDREVLAYAKALPAFVAFQREKGLSDAEAFVAFPKVYASKVDSEYGYILVMGDLRVDEFSMWPYNKGIPLANELLVMKELGKLHGVSFALKDQRPAEFEEYKTLTDTFRAIANGGMNSYFRQSVKLSRRLMVEPAHAAIFDGFDMDQMLEACFAADGFDRFGVVCHGDCWNNNCMYKYADENKQEVTSLSMVDWQLMRYCSPAIDLLLNIFSTTEEDLREKHFQQLITTYYASLSATIRRLGSDPDRLFTYADLQSELRRFAGFGLLCGAMYLRAKVAEVSDIHDLDDYSNALDNGEEADLFKVFDEAKLATFSKHINAVVRHLHEFGYVS